mmetsp:Transcript_89169/g.174511  ORF Transcript_89169/g.174511 Transcript_89169/m.174511 type:complete len:221 (+) Transcript_89169:3-665(+)
MMVRVTLCECTFGLDGSTTSPPWVFDCTSSIGSCVAWLFSPKSCCCCCCRCCCSSFSLWNTREILSKEANRFGGATVSPRRSDAWPSPSRMTSVMHFPSRQRVTASHSSNLPSTSVISNLLVMLSPPADGSTSGNGGSFITSSTSKKLEAGSVKMCGIVGNRELKSGPRGNLRSSNSGWNFSKSLIMRWSRALKSGPRPMRRWSKSLFILSSTYFIMRSK